MKSFAFVSLIGALSLLSVQQTFAQGGYGGSMGGGAHPATQPSYTTNRPNGNDTYNSGSQNAVAKGPLGASISLSDGSHSGASFPAKTRQLSASFTTTGTNKGDKLQAVWISSVNGRKKINTTALTGDQANFGGSVSINGPASGWPAGKYELDLFVNNKLVAHQPFTMKQ